MNELSLNDIQEQAFKILMDVDAFCRKNNIRYLLAYGTLLGAIRHKGFIPWDDDIDIMMERSQYEKFLDLYETKGTYRVINYKTEKKCPFMISRISNDEYYMISEFGPRYTIGAFIDIYPLDGIGKKTHIKAYERKSKWYCKFLQMRLERNPFHVIHTLYKGRSIKKWLLIPLYYVIRLIPVNYFRKKILKMSSQYSWEGSDYVGCLSWSFNKSDAYPKEWVTDIIDISFEGEKVMASSFFDEMLSQNYGDYMELPPKNKRYGHHFYKLYRKNEFGNSS